MINLLPPDIKEQISYSRRSLILRNYILLAIAVGMLLSGTLWAGQYYLKNQIAAADTYLGDKQVQSNRFGKARKKTEALNARLTAIQAIQKKQAKFSVLLGDLAQSMPPGTAISSISLTGDDTKPVRLAVRASSYQAALAFRDSIVSSKRISAADIQDIKAVQNKNVTTYNVTVTCAFNPGAAR